MCTQEEEKPYFAKKFPLPLPVGQDFLLIGLWQYRLKYSCRSVGVPEQGYDLFYIVAGEGWVHYQNRKDKLKSGEMFSSDAQEPVELLPQESTGLSVIQLRFDFQADTQFSEENAIIRKIFSDHMVEPVEGSNEMHSAWNALITEMKESGAFREILLELLIRQLLIYFHRSYLKTAFSADVVNSFSDGQQAIVEETVRYIDSHILYLKNVSNVSKILGYSYSYLSHSFFKITGGSLRDYFQKKRLEKAVEMLKDNLSITEVSDMLGYATVHSFSRAFSRQMGCPPGNFKQKTGLTTGKQPVCHSFDDFEGLELDWESDDVYGSMHSMDRVAYPRHSGTRALAMEFNVTSDWRVDRYGRRRPDFSLVGMKYLSFWAKSTSQVTVEIKLVDSRGQTFVTLVDVSTVGSVRCLPLEEFQPADEARHMTMQIGVGLYFYFRGINNTGKPSIGRLFLDEVGFVDTDISILTEYSSKNDWVELPRNKTPFIMPPSVIARPRNLVDLNRLCHDTGFTVGVELVLHENLNVYSLWGNPLGTLSNVFVKIYQKLMPLFMVSDQNVADALIEYLNEKGFQDVFVISSHVELLRYIHERYCILRSVWDCTGETPSLKDRWATCHAAGSRIMLLPEDTPRETVEVLQQRQIAVWLQQRMEEENLPVRLHRMLTSGAMGLVTDQPEQIYPVMQVYEENTMLHRPYITAYGFEDVYSWDTMEAAEMAEKYGADYVALDIFLTRDQQLVAIPERAVENYTTDGMGDVEKYTWEELSGMRYNRNRHLACQTAPFALLEDFYARFASRALRFFLSIYEDEERVVHLLQRLTCKWHMESRVTYVVGGTVQIQRIRKRIPGAPILNRGLYDNQTWNSFLSLPEIITNLQLYNTVFSPRYMVMEKLVDIIHNLWHRGVSSWTYYFDDQTLLASALYAGVSGMTTNRIQRCGDWMRELRAQEEKITLCVGCKQEIRAIMTSFSGQTALVEPAITVLSGEFTVVGNSLYTEKPTEGWILLRYVCQLREGMQYFKYSQPVFVRAE